jgi:hypothetical protein
MQNDENNNISPHGSNTILAAAFVSRCKRKFRPHEDLKMKSSGKILDLIDLAIKEIYRITDDEYDYLAENLSEDELFYFVSETLSFGEKKECLRIVQNHLSNFYAVPER